MSDGEFVSQTVIMIMRIMGSMIQEADSLDICPGKL